MKMEFESDIIITAKMKDKTERRRSSIFNILKKKKISRQLSEPGNGNIFGFNRKYSVDSAILSDFTKVDNYGYKMCLEKAESKDVFVSHEGLL